MIPQLTLLDSELGNMTAHIVVIVHFRNMPAVLHHRKMPDPHVTADFHGGGPVCHADTPDLVFKGHIAQNLTDFGGIHLQQKNTAHISVFIQPRDGCLLSEASGVRILFNGPEHGELFRHQGGKGIALFQAVPEKRRTGQKLSSRGIIQRNPADAEAFGKFAHLLPGPLFLRNVIQDAVGNAALHQQFLSEPLLQRIGDRDLLFHLFGRIRHPGRGIAEDFRVTGELLQQQPECQCGRQHQHPGYLQPPEKHTVPAGMCVFSRSPGRIPEMQHGIQQKDAGHHSLQHHQHADLTGHIFPDFRIRQQAEGEHIFGIQPVGIAVLPIHAKRDNLPRIPQCFLQFSQGQPGIFSGPQKLLIRKRLTCHKPVIRIQNAPVFPVQDHNRACAPDPVVLQLRKPVIVIAKCEFLLTDVPFRNQKPPAVPETPGKEPAVFHLRLLRSRKSGFHRFELLKNPLRAVRETLIQKFPDTLCGQGNGFPVSYPNQAAAVPVKDGHALQIGNAGIFPEEFLRIPDIIEAGERHRQGVHPGIFYSGRAELREIVILEQRGNLLGDCDGNFPHILQRIAAVKAVFQPEQDDADHRLKQQPDSNDPGCFSFDSVFQSVFLPVCRISALTLFPSDVCP